MIHQYRRTDYMRNSSIIMYTTEDGLTKIETTFDEDTVWLSLDQMAELFQRDKSTISRHIKNIFEVNFWVLLIICKYWMIFF